MCAIIELNLVANRGDIVLISQASRLYFCVNCILWQGIVMMQISCVRLKQGQVRFVLYEKTGTLHFNAYK